MVAEYRHALLLLAFVIWSAHHVNCRRDVLRLAPKGPIRGLGYIRYSFGRARQSICVDQMLQPRDAQPS
eukprot:8425984-Pyramimonas_sp.AAC.1